MGKIKTVKISANSTKGWFTRSFFQKSMDAEINQWAKKGYRLISTTPVTKTKSGLAGTTVETTHYILTFEKI
jgi:hypothetical protein